MLRRRPARATRFRRQTKTNGFEAFDMPSKEAILSFTMLVLLQFIARMGGFN